MSRDRVRAAARSLEPPDRLSRVRVSGVNHPFLPVLGPAGAPAAPGASSAVSWPAARRAASSGPGEARAAGRGECEPRSGGRGCRGSQGLQVWRGSAGRLEEPNPDSHAAPLFLPRGPGAEQGPPGLQLPIQMFCR